MNMIPSTIGLYPTLYQPDPLQIHTNAAPSIFILASNPLICIHLRVEHVLVIHVHLQRFSNIRKWRSRWLGGVSLCGGRVSWIAWKRHNNRWASWCRRLSRRSGRSGCCSSWAMEFTPCLPYQQLIDKLTDKKMKVWHCNEFGNWHMTLQYSKDNVWVLLCDLKLR